MLKKLIFASLLMGASFVSVNAQEYTAGVHYQVLPKQVSTKSPDKVEVAAVFGYACPHCNSLEPVLSAWSKSIDPEQIDLTHLPVVFSKSWEPLARAYYIAEMSSMVEETHQALFDAVHIEKRKINSEESVADFFEEHGLEREKVNQLYDSFAMDTKLRGGDVKLRDYQVSSVPAFVVNGKYRLNAAMAGSNAEMFKVLDYLVEKESNAL